jgi:hypothetical protein
MQYKSTYFKFSVNKDFATSGNAYKLRYDAEFQAQRLLSINIKCEPTNSYLRKIGVLAEDQTIIDLPLSKIDEILERNGLRGKITDAWRVLPSIVIKKDRLLIDKVVALNVSQVDIEAINSLLTSLNLLQPNVSVLDIDSSRLKELEDILMKPPYFYGHNEIDINRLSELSQLKGMIQDADKSRFSVEDHQNLNNHLAEIAADGWKLHSMQPITRTITYKNNPEIDSHSIQEGFVILWEKN